MSIFAPRIFHTLDRAKCIWPILTYRKLNNKPIVVQADRLNELLSRSDCITQNIGGTSYKVLRFVLCADGTLNCGAEGKPRDHIPSHSQLAGEQYQCTSAGNLFFDANNKLCMINHQSGDFRPSFDSLQFALTAFVKSNIIMSQTITLIKLNNNGAFVQSYSIQSKLIKLYESTDCQRKLESCGSIGKAILNQIKRLEKGSSSNNVYWSNCSKKLIAIIKAVDNLPLDINELDLNHIITDSKTELYRALNMQRLFPVTFFGSLNLNHSITLQSIEKADSNEPSIYLR